MWKAWIHHFAANRRPEPCLDAAGLIEIAPEVRRRLVRSLQRFQLGESGDGRFLLRGARRYGDAGLCEAMQLFVREEQRHARVLAMVIRALGGTLLRRHWSDAAFVVVRRSAGFRGEVMVLFIAEILGMLYYGALRDGSAHRSLRAVFADIHDDEVDHLRFHVAWLGPRLRELRPSTRWLLRRAWTLLFRAACLALVLDHRQALACVGVDPKRFRRRANSLFREMTEHLFGCVSLTRDDHELLAQLAP